MAIHIEVQFIIAGRKMVQLDKVIMDMGTVQVAGSLVLHSMNLKVKQLKKFKLKLLDKAEVVQVQ